MHATKNPWIINFKPNPQAKMRLICVPCAGAGAGMYRGWAAKLPPEVEMIAVQLPGRETRFNEPSLDSLETVVAGAREALTPWLNLPYVIFGHSYGSLIGFELTHALQDAGRAPARLILSGNMSPNHPNHNPPLRHLADDELIEALGKLNGTPRAVLECPELMELFLPVIRADFTALEVYGAAQREARDPLRMPISVYAGETDPRVTPEGLAAWERESHHGANVTIMDGDHFYLIQKEAELVGMIARELEEVLRSHGGS